MMMCSHPLSKGCLGKLFDSSLSCLPRVFLVCRFPSMIRTDLFSSNLLIVGEDEVNCVFAAVSGKQPVSVVIYGIQSHLQEQILQLLHSNDNLRQILLFHERFFSATCVDLTIGVRTTLRRHLSHIHKICRYKNFAFTQAGRTRPVTKGTYFIALCSAHNTGSFEVFLPCVEYAETWLSSSMALTTHMQASITAVPGLSF